MNLAADPGLLVEEGLDSYSLSSDMCALLETSLTALSRMPLLALEKLKPIELETWTYNPLSWKDESGAMHRWTFVDRWDEDTFNREMHSWATAADLAFYETPLTIHAIVVGHRRLSRQISPWTRGKIQPVIGKLRFTDNDAWKNVWYSDFKGGPDEWVDAMIRDDSVSKLVHHATIKEFSTDVAKRVKNEFKQVVESMRLQLDNCENPLGLPMSRHSCERCSWMPACYRNSYDTPIEELGPFRKR
jgi:hypothetical protein